MKRWNHEVPLEVAAEIAGLSPAALEAAARRGEVLARRSARNLYRFAPATVRELARRDAPPEGRR